MKPHKHAELIKAWADGAEIEIYSSYDNEWIRYSEGENPSWGENYEYRIKPETKPDVIVKWFVRPREVTYFDSRDQDTKNLKLTFDGETGKLKSAEVL